MYESPIEMFSVTDYAHHIDEQIENAVYEAITKVGINVNKEELIKALQYDRHQYEKGYEDGAKERKTGRWIVHAKQEIYDNVCECNLCGGEVIGVYAFCPNCGAQMEVDDE